MAREQRAVGSIPIRFRHHTEGLNALLLRAAFRYFEHSGRKADVRVDGPLIFNTTAPQVDTALAGLGLVFLPNGGLMPLVESGRLVRVLSDWWSSIRWLSPAIPEPTPTLSRSLRVAQASRIGTVSAT